MGKHKIKELVIRSDNVLPISFGDRMVSIRVELTNLGTLELTRDELTRLLVGDFMAKALQHNRS